MTQTPRDWQKDMELGHVARYEYDIRHLNNVLDALFYWLQEAKKWRERYEQRPTFELLEAAQALYEHHNARADKSEGREKQVVELFYDTLGCLVMYTGQNNSNVTRIVAKYHTLYPDTLAPTTENKQPETARPIDEWHEDYGDVLWWTFPIQEPPYCSGPLDADWPDYHTHWTPLVIPTAPALKEDLEHKCPGCGWIMVPQWGGDEGPESHWDDCQNPDCDYEEGDNQ